MELELEQEEDQELYIDPNTENDDENSTKELFAVKMLYRQIQYSLQDIIETYKIIIAKNVKPIDDIDSCPSLSSRSRCMSHSSSNSNYNNQPDTESSITIDSNSNINTSIDTIDNIEICKNIRYRESLYDLNKAIFFYSNKLTKISNIIDDLDVNIQSQCDHVFVDDIIDIDCDQSQSITYCIHCEYTKP